MYLVNTLVEHDDHVEVNGVVFNKPFVEKPVSAEDHNIYMYYPTSAGEERSLQPAYVGRTPSLCGTNSFLVYISVSRDARTYIFRTRQLRPHSHS